MLDMMYYFMEEGDETSNPKVTESGQNFEDLYLDGLHSQTVEDKEDLDQAGVSAA